MERWSAKLSELRNTGATGRVETQTTWIIMNRLVSHAVKWCAKNFPMLATLIIPSSEGVSQAYPLRLESFEGHPVLFSSRGHTINGTYFQLLRDRMGARIETDDVSVVAGILGLPANEPGLSATF